MDLSFSLFFFRAFFRSLALSSFVESIRSYLPGCAYNDEGTPHLFDTQIFPYFSEMLRGVCPDCVRVSTS